MLVRRIDDTPINGNKVDINKFKASVEQLAEVKDALEYFYSVDGDGNITNNVTTVKDAADKLTPELLKKINDLYTNLKVIKDFTPNLEYVIKVNNIKEEILELAELAPKIELLPREFAKLDDLKSDMCISTTRALHFAERSRSSLDAINLKYLMDIEPSVNLVKNLTDELKTDLATAVAQIKEGHEFAAGFVLNNVDIKLCNMSYEEGPFISKQDNGRYIINIPRPVCYNVVELPPGSYATLEDYPIVSADEFCNWILPPEPSNPPLTRPELDALISAWRENQDNVDKQNAIINANVSQITDMRYVFGISPLMSLDDNFNLDISGWDVSSVTDMKGMFLGAASFNQPINNWDVSNVTDMESMFHNAINFNQDISAWNVSNATNMYSMFFNAAEFNKDISSWDVSKVTNMGEMFRYAIAFDQDISGWNVSNVTSWEPFKDYSPLTDAHTPSKFLQASTTALTRPELDALINEWNADQDNVDKQNAIINANVSQITDMNMLFYDEELFNLDISGWDTSNVTNMNNMFGSMSYAMTFNQDIGSWDTSNVTDMSFMFFGFGDGKFNQDISNWNVDKVTNWNSFGEGSALTDAHTPPKFR